jgi:hypothetical protein
MWCYSVLGWLTDTNDVRGHYTAMFENRYICYADLEIRTNIDLIRKEVKFVQAIRKIVAAANGWAYQIKKGVWR